jgi:histidinol phosphatase-like enzyme (inositol monophosphatase family)
MNADELAALLDFAIDVATDAGRLILGHYQSSLTIDTKPDESPVTIADRAAEQLIRRRIAASYPADAILGEEFGAGSANPPRDAADAADAATPPIAHNGRRWIVDPIDGTRSFIRGVPIFGVMLAFELEGDVVAGVLHFPALGETVAAARGLGCMWNGRPARVSNTSATGDALVLTTDARNFVDTFDGGPMLRTWGDCYGYALVATGRAECMFDPVLSPWDVAALIPIIEEAGGVITDMDGSASWPMNSAIATNAALADEFRMMLRADAAGIL